MEVSSRARDVTSSSKGDGVQSPVSMDEDQYRESRLCRLLGNPVIYQITVVLAQHGPLTPSGLAKIIGRSVQTVSGHLAKMRAADVVRYDTEGRQTRYWLKHGGEMKRLLEDLAKVVEASARLR